MGYRIVINMDAAPGAEARLWALVSQRHVDVTSAWFHKDRTNREIMATLDVELDLVGTRRLMRQLARHHDIRTMRLDPAHTADTIARTQRLSIPPRAISVKKGAIVS